MTKLTIISWNCAGAFRNKAKAIFAQEADVYCIQECEAPSKHEKTFANILEGRNIIWKGNDPKRDRGVAVISRPEIALKRLSWPGGEYRDFLPVLATDGTAELELVNVWACDPYIEMFNTWLDAASPFVSGKTILIGDFNSNKIWDGKHGVQCHTEAVSRLAKKGLVSAYHHVTGEEQGAERQPTFCLYRHADRPYHLDYAFADEGSISGFRVLDDPAWMEKSDHFPIELELDPDRIRR